MNSILHRLQREIAFSLRGLDATQTQLRPPSRPPSGASSRSSNIFSSPTPAPRPPSTPASPNALPLAQNPPYAAHLSIRRHPLRLLSPRSRSSSDGHAAQPTTHPLSGEDLTHATAEHLAHLDLLFTEAEALFGPASQMRQPRRSRVRSTSTNGASSNSFTANTTSSRFRHPQSPHPLAENANQYAT